MTTQHERRPDASDLEALWELSEELLSITGMDGTFLQVNRTWRRVLGWTIDELTARPFIDFVHPDDRDRTLEAFQDMTRPGAQVDRFENRYEHRDGSYRWLSWTARTDDAGERIYAVTRDVTAQHESETALRASERLFRQAMSGAPIGMALVGLDGRWLEVNDALCRILGYPSERLRQLTFQDVTHPDDLDDDVGHVERLLAGEIDDYTLEKRYVRADGGTVWVLLSVSMVRDEAGEPLMFISQIQDITPRKAWEREQRRLVAELERSNADLEQFAATASHDLTSPLAAARGFIDLVLEDDTLSEDSRDLLRLAMGRVTSSIELTRGMLRFSRLGVTELTLEPVDTDLVVRSVAERVAADRDAGSVEVQVERLPRVRGDASAITTLFANLIENAVKFSPGGHPCRVRVTSLRDGDDVVIAVEDEGPGIAPEDRDRVFEAFTRTSSGEGVPGSGLGLATCQRIVERLGGAIAATEPTGGRGARLEVRLPSAMATTHQLPNGAHEPELDSATG